KLSGVYVCEKSSEHGLIRDCLPPCHVPHSRYHDLPEQALLKSGYQVLSRSDEVGADLFIKQRRSLFLFCQGHPEYDLCPLHREYRADVLKFLNGERDIYPRMPRNYFDADTADVLEAFRQ